MRSETTSDCPIHKVNFNATIKCWHCNKEGNTPDYCISKLRECYSCCEEGHIESTFQQVKKFKKHRKVNIVKHAELMRLVIVNLVRRKVKRMRNFKRQMIMGYYILGVSVGSPPPPTDLSRCIHT